MQRQTVYGGEPEECAYAESLAAFRVAADLRETKAGDIFEGSRRDSRRSLLELIEDEWQASNHMGPGKMPADWREVRNLYRVTLPTEGWLVDIAHSETVTALNDALPGLLAQHGIDQLSLGDLLGENRELTTRISEWIWDVYLDDGTQPHGVIFPSKHGDDFTCVAVYLRRLADGMTLASEPTKADSGSDIKKPEQNAPLKKIVTLFNLRCY